MKFSLGTWQSTKAWLGLDRSRIRFFNYSICNCFERSNYSDTVTDMGRPNYKARKSNQFWGSFKCLCNCEVESKYSRNSRTLFLQEYWNTTISTEEVSPCCYSLVINHFIFCCFNFFHFIFFHLIMSFNFVFYFIFFY